MGTPETTREPCPDRILDDIGGAFGMGVVGGSGFHFMKGFFNSPKGSRLVGASQAVRLHAPRLGGSFAVWGGLFSTFDCTMVYVRQKEDPWNSIISGFAAGGFLSLRQGPAAATRSAVFGGILLALMEGGMIMFNKALSTREMPPLTEEPMLAGYPSGVGFPGQHGPQPAPPTASESEAKTSWFGGFFGGEKKEEPAFGGGSETKILESFDAPPVPNFEYK
ncbi:mitochondrial import inner membrane translocase subunit TIM17-2-like [Arachis duranensis]|uniref:Mitochondrial import inner membrane translocase subunit TIM17-2-like n=1 Tax=Arachis duranensis TaxID=130453 RepID=A0A6P4B7F4_ARADU|nr:mitochondrial import inner membrane translocase subunit TIM17-2-like [Arachis duranensis]